MKQLTAGRDTVFEIDRNTHSHTLKKIANYTEYVKTDLIFLECVFFYRKIIADVTVEHAASIIRV